MIDELQNINDKLNFNNNKPEDTLKTCKDAHIILSKFFTNKIFSLTDLNNNIPLNINPTITTTLISKIIQKIKKNHNKVKITVENKHPNYFIKCDTKKIETTIINSITYMIDKFSVKELKLTIDIKTLNYNLYKFQKTINGIYFHISAEHNNKLNEKELCNLNPYTLSEHTESIFNTHTPLILHIKTINAHYGTYEFITKLNSVTHNYTIPTNVREIRQKFKDSPRKHIDTHYNQNIGHITLQERTLLNKIDTLDNNNISLARKAISIAKKYHAKEKNHLKELLYLDSIKSAEIILKHVQNENIIIACILYNVVRKTKLSLREVEQLFNPSIQKIIQHAIYLNEIFTKNLQLGIKNLRNHMIPEYKNALYIITANKLRDIRAADNQINSVKTKVTAIYIHRYYMPVAKYLQLTTVIVEYTKFIRNINANKEILHPADWHDLTSNSLIVPIRE